MSLAIQKQNANTHIPLATMPEELFRNIHQYLDPESRANLASTSTSLYEREISIRNHKAYGALKRLISDIIKYLPKIFSKEAEELSKLNQGIELGNWCVPLLKKDVESLKEDIIHILEKIWDDEVTEEIEMKIELPADCKDIFKIAENFRTLRRCMLESPMDWANAVGFHAFSNLIHLGRMEQALQMLVQSGAQDLLNHLSYTLLREERKENVPIIFSVIKCMESSMDRNANPDIRSTLITNENWLFWNGNDFCCYISPKVFFLERLINVCVENRLWEEAIEAAALLPLDGPICFSDTALQSLTMRFCDFDHGEFEFAIKAAQSISNRSIRMTTFDAMIDYAEQFSSAGPEEISRMLEARKACSKYGFENLSSCQFM